MIHFSICNILTLFLRSLRRQHDLTKHFEEQQEEFKGGRGEKLLSSIRYLAFVSLLSQCEANKELTSQRVQRQLLSLNQSH